MPERRSPTPAERNAALIHETAERAVALALTGSKEATASAVARAVRDQRVDSDLRTHERRLDAINGSQERMANSLGELAKASERQAAVGEALAENASAQAGARFSKRQLWIACVGAMAAWGGIIVAVVISGT